MTAHAFGNEKSPGQRKAEFPRALGRRRDFGTIAGYWASGGHTPYTTGRRLRQRWRLTGSSPTPIRGDREMIEKFAALLVLA